MEREKPSFKDRIKKILDQKPSHVSPNNHLVNTYFYTESPKRANTRLKFKDRIKIMLHQEPSHVSPNNHLVNARFYLTEDMLQD